MSPKFTADSPSVSIDDFLRGSPLDLAHRMAARIRDEDAADDRPGDPP